MHTQINELAVKDAMFMLGYLLLHGFQPVIASTGAGIVVEF